MEQEIVIHWFRQDLRRSDNPAFAAAAASGSVLPIYILDDVNAADNAMGGASRWWLHHSLISLNHSLGGKLAIYRGDARKILPTLAKRIGAKAVYWNRCYEPWRIARDTQVKEALQKQNMQAQSFNGSLLWEPWDALKEDSTPYKVFTPFYQRGCLRTAPREPLPAPAKISFAEDSSALTIEALELLPRIRWDKQLIPHWKIGEEAAQERLYDFLERDIPHYKQGRDFPASGHVSRLSPYLHFGEISPHQAWHAARTRTADANTERFCTELGWREFSHSLLYYHPDLPDKNLQAKFDAFPWRDDNETFLCWQRGMTGYPIVDAGMRELWQTGYMHNRVRMIVGSFLVKNLLLDWRHGRSWFWDCLVDADLANNSASWQWIAGCGADAAPYFRIFNPVTQGKKFDPDGAYTRRFVPELQHLPDAHLFNPWEVPDDILKKAQITLGKTYPLPIVDAPKSRARALAAFATLRKA